MRTVRVYQGTNDCFWAYLDKDLEIVKQEDLCDDFSKLKVKLDKEKSNDESVIGIVDSKIIRLKFFSNGKYLGLIWAGNKKLSGTYSKS